MRVITCDTETTGLPLPSSAHIDKQPRLIELAVIIRENNEIVDELEWKFNPGNLPLDPVITKITGIKTEDLIDEPTFKSCLADIKKAFYGADVFIAHNANFDKSVIDFDLERAGCFDFPWPELIICSAQEMTPYFGFRPKASQLYEHFTGKKIKQTHRALDDTRMLDEALQAANFFEFL